MYIGTVLLNRTEDQFWRMSLRQLLALFDEHCRFNGIEKQEEQDQNDVIKDMMSWIR